MSLLALGKQAQEAREEALRLVPDASRGQAAGPQTWRASPTILLRAWGPLRDRRRHGWPKAGPTVFPEPRGLGPCWLCVPNFSFSKSPFWKYSLHIVQFTLYDIQFYEF